MFYNRIARIDPARANDGKILANGLFNSWWRNVTKKELSANLYNNRKIAL